MHADFYTTTIQFKFSDKPETGEFEGYGAVFGNQDAHGDVIQPGAFAASLADLARLGRRVPMHLNHGLPEMAGRRGVGVWQDVAEDAKGLRVKGKISGMNTDAGRLLYEQVKDGAFPGLSIGYRVKPGGAIVGKLPSEPPRRLTSLDLHEISLVDSPANPEAQVTSVKTLANRAELESMLREGGLPRAAARKIASAGWAAFSGDAKEPEPEDLADDPAFKTLDTYLSAAIGELKTMGKL